MNFPTHVMFGILVGAVFFGKPEIMLLMGLGSAIPDLDREYGFFSRESFRSYQLHRALCHSFIFLGMVYLVNPFLGLGAFLHTLLDALTTTRDRGVEWLYPFSRWVKKSVYDSYGKKVELDPKRKIYFAQYEPLALTRKTTQDLKPADQPLPWRRTYGPALSGRLLDEGIFAGSAALTLLLLLFSALGIQSFIDLSPYEVGYSFALPFLLGFFGGFVNFVAGEIDRRKQANKPQAPKFEREYRVVFAISVGVMVFAVILGAVMNPQAAISTIAKIPYIAAGIALIILVSFLILKIRSSKRLPGDDDKEPVIV